MLFCFVLRTTSVSPLAREKGGGHCPGKMQELFADSLREWIVYFCNFRACRLAERMAERVAVSLA